MKNILLTLHAQTSLHAGSGQNDDVIDLPVQREAHTGYPCVFGSSMKGALRAHAQMRSKIEESTVNRLFGKEGDGDSGNAGAVLVSDARLLLLPIRSLMGQFRWVTCPMVLKRFKQDCQRFGQPFDIAVPEVAQSEQVLTVSEDPSLYLEEYRFERIGGIDDKWLTQLASVLAYDDAKNMLEQQLAIINNDDFAYLAQYTLPVNPHIALDSAKKTTKPGALWYEETLPSDSVLYVGVAVDDERKQGGASAEALAGEFKTLFAENQWLQIGGNETVGMGWCSVATQEGK